jgi:hypothetical protein
MQDFNGIHWMLDGSEYQPQETDELSEKVIQSLENLESLLSEAAFQRRYDVIHKAIRTFAALNQVLVQDAVKQYETDNPSEPMQ